MNAKILSLLFTLEDFVRAAEYICTIIIIQGPRIK